MDAAFVNNDTEKTADIEAAQLLQGLRTYPQVAGDAAARGAAHASGAAAASTPVPQKRGRPVGN